MKSQVVTENFDFQIGARARLDFIKKRNGVIARAIEDAVNFQVPDDEVEGPLRLEMKIKDQPPKST